MLQIHNSLTGRKEAFQPIRPGEVRMYVCGPAVALDEDAAREVSAAGAGFFAQALTAWDATAPDFKSWVRTVGSAAGRKGAALYMPVRAALTGHTHGPELAPLVALMGRERVAERIAAAGTLAAAG